MKKTTDDSLLALVHEICTPAKYVGQNACGHFLFAQENPVPTHIFETLELAMKTLGRAVVIEGSSIQSPRFHAGYNAGLFGKRYDPCTRITDGAPRTLTDKETDEYTHGYMHGIQMRPKS